MPTRAAAKERKRKPKPSQRSIKPPVATSSQAPASPKPEGDSRRLRLELDIHREELASQNDELRRANAELVTTKERYAELYDGAPVAYFTLDGVGTIIEANLAGGELLDAPRNLLFGRRFDELVVLASRESFRAFLRRVLEHGGRAVHDTLLAMGGRRVPVRVEAARLANAAFPAGRCLLCVTDETERRQLDQERRALEARVAEAQRIESLGLLAGGVAHDFNNTLAVVLAHADLVLLDAKESSGTHAAVTEIRQAAVRAADLSKQMLAYSGRGRMRADPVDVSRIIRSMSALLASSASKDVQIVLDLADDLPLVLGDSVLIQQIVVNLVVNASEAIAPGAGKIMIRTRSSSESPAEGTSVDGTVVIEVTDDGRGMDETTRMRAFDPFFSTKLSGRGLGLAVVHGNVRAHAGTVVLDSRLNGGSTFRVFLPVTARPTAARPANDVVKDLTWRGSGLVLVVDDEEDVREAAGLVLERLGFDVCFAADGIEALAVVRRPPSPLVAVLLDLTMPRMDGHATLAELSLLAPALPVVVTSGFSRASLDDKLMASTAGFVAKPFTLATLQQGMQQALRRPPRTKTS